MGTDDRTRDPLGLGPGLHDLNSLLRENARLRALLEVAAEACRLREITPHLIDVLDAEGFETAPRGPETDVWLPSRDG